MLPPSLNVLRKFGRAIYDGNAFTRLCAANRIEIVISHDVTRGYYYYANGQDTIVLSAHLTARERAFVAWHEFAHFLQNYYPRQVTASASGLQLCENTAKERLADVFALIATRPDQIRITGPQDFLNMIMTLEGDNAE